MSSSQGQEKTSASAKNYAYNFVKVNDDLRAPERHPGFLRSPFCFHHLGRWSSLSDGPGWACVTAGVVGPGCKKPLNSYGNA
jgi:hypothetical protein